MVVPEEHKASSKGLMVRCTTTREARTKWRKLPISNAPFALSARYVHPGQDAVMNVCSRLQIPKELHCSAPTSVDLSIVD